MNQEGVLTNILRYVIVKERKSFVEKETVNKLNRIALWTGCLAFLGLTYVAVNPVGFPAPDKQDYLWSVFATHNVGGFTTMICFNIYFLFQSYLAYNQRETYRGYAVILILLSIPIVTTSLIISATFYFVVADVNAHIVVERTGFATLPNFQYTFFPLMDALLEWIFAFFVFVYFATFSTDFKYMKIVLQLQPKQAVTEERIVSRLCSLSPNGYYNRRSFDNVIFGKNEKKRE